MLITYDERQLLSLEDTWRPDCSYHSGIHLCVYSSIPAYTCTPCFCLPHTPLPSPCCWLSHTYPNITCWKRHVVLLVIKTRVSECELTAGALPAGSTLAQLVFLINKCTPWAGYTHYIRCGIAAGKHIFSWERKQAQFLHKTPQAHKQFSIYDLHYIAKSIGTPPSNEQVWLL